MDILLLIKAHDVQQKFFVFLYSNYKHQTHVQSNKTYHQVLISARVDTISLGYEF
jgi:hypothetical protein